MKELLIAISGVILFLVGMIRLSSSVRRMVDARIKELVRYAVDRPLYGLVTGVVSAVFFQSSSASTALTIGLVSAGLISFYSSLAIVLGADIGTTLTVQFVIWRFTEFSPVFITAGGLLWLACRGRWKDAGEMIFYFGLIFFGLEIISQAAAPLKESPRFLHYFTQAKNPLIGLGVGIAATALVQASAIPIAILAVLAQQDLVRLENAVPVVLGANIGTTVTALLAGMVANINGRKTAVSHLIFKCAGVLLCLAGLPLFIDLLRQLSGSVPQQIALSHFLLNLLIVAVFIFFLRPFATLVDKMLPGKDEVLPLWPEYLKRRDLADPAAALHHVFKELRRQMKLAQVMFARTLRILSVYDEATRRGIVYVEMAVNNLRAQIVRFLWQISGRELSADLSRRVFAYTAMAGDIQSIGNHVQAISALAEERSRRKIRFSACGEQDMEEVLTLVERNLTEAATLLERFNVATVQEVIRREEEIDVRVKEILDRHLKRFHQRECSPEAGPIFVEMLGHLERISDLCDNIAEYVWEVQ
ncbi:MAG: Na/Pi cotransporter family protein [Smithellaceae bacterium]|nr:Na/Pi cotransporter family protein [Syntrophaceae bacterium]MDD4241034.1 Na/Pi cotransporter family protein [Smithellaceae bacterium]NLX53067.1 Na/Pi cotransporter family protein [Deltaproteobacteria bacterium]